MLRRLLRTAAVLTAYAVLTVVMTGPAFRRPQTRVMGWPGDQFLFLWSMGWYRRCIQRKKNPLLVDRVNPPEGVSLGTNESAPAQSLMTMPLVARGHHVLAYNLALFVSFVGSAYAMYRWVRARTGDTVAGFAAGAIFAFSPNRIMHANGHLAQVSTQWVPVLFSRLDKLMSRGRFSPGRAIGTGMILGCVTAHCAYLGYQSFWASVCHVIAAAFRRRTSFLNFALNSFTYLFFSMIFFAIFALPMIHAARRRETSGHHPDEIDKNSAQPGDWFIPTRSQVLWNKMGWAATRPMAVERTLYLGMVPLALAIVGLTGNRRRETVAMRWLGAAVGCMVLAHGTRLYWNGRKTPVMLPASLLFRFAPGYASARVSARYATFVSMYVSALMGLGLARARTRWPIASGALAAGAMSAGLAEIFCRPIQTTDAAPRAVDVWLSRQPAGLMVELPPGHFVERQLYGTLFHPHPLLGTLHPVHRPERFRKFCRAYWNTTDAELPGMLVAHKIRYVLIHPSAMQRRPAIAATIARSDRTVHFETIGGVMVCVLASDGILPASDDCAEPGISEVLPTRTADV